MEKKGSNNLLFLGVSILLIGILLLSYSYSSYKEVKTLENKVNFEDIDNNTSMSTSDKYFKYLSIADFLNQKLNKNKGLLFKNSTCVYLDYAQHNAIALYRLTYNGMQTEESRRSVAAGNIRSLYTMMDNYRTCNQTEGYKKELGNILSDIQKTDDLHSQSAGRMESFMRDYNEIPVDQMNPQQRYKSENYSSPAPLSSEPSVSDDIQDNQMSEQLQNQSYSNNNPVQNPDAPILRQ